MTQFLPPNLLALFAPRDPVPFLPPACKLPHEKKNRGYIGVGDFLDSFEDPCDTPAPIKVETREERSERRRREKAEQVAYKLEQEIAVWDPHGSLSSTTDAFKTLFVARINYDTSESKLRREFEVYGPIKKIVMIHNKISGKPRGYAFIEYEHERDMHSAYKHADGKKIDGRRVLVDVERARTVKGWLPRRLGGGLGGTRRGGPEVNLKHSGREDNERERERYKMEREREAERDRRDRDSRVDRDRDGRMDRERDREVIKMERDRERERDRRPRSRSREKKRRSRSRSRERKRRRSSRDRMPISESGGDISEGGGEESRSRDRRDRKRSRRSRSRERKHSRRGESRRERDRDRERISDPDREEKVRIKIEPPDDYPDYSNHYDSEQYDIDTSIKYEKDDKQGHHHQDSNDADGVGDHLDEMGSGDDKENAYMDENSSSVRYHPDQY